MKRFIVTILAALSLAGASGAALNAEGWTWDEDSGSTIIAGPHEGGEI